VTHAAAALVLLVVLLDLKVFHDLTLLFDLAFVLICVAAALAVRPRDFFTIGVLPPLLMAATVAVLALVARDAVADPTDGFWQAVVSGLAHHSGFLVLGYALTLVILALRQLAMRNAGAIRGHSHNHNRVHNQGKSGRTGGSHVPEQRAPEARVSR
jgi:hypothetical protein